MSRSRPLHEIQTKHQYRRLGTVVIPVLLMFGALALSLDCGSDGGPTAPAAEGLQVIAVTPTDQSSGVSLFTTITARFNRPLDASTVTPASFNLGDQAGAIATADSSIIFTPDSPLLPDFDYTLTITTAVTDSAGTSLTDDFNSTFTTIATLDPPISDAGPDQDVNMGETVTLDGGGSEDPTGLNLNYIWRQIAGPDMGDLTEGATFSFVAPDTVGVLLVELMARSPAGAGAPDTVSVFVFENKDHAFFVASDGDDDNPGTRAAPFATINRAKSAAIADGYQADVYVAEGDYEESIAFVDLVSYYGGFDPMTWVRDPGLTISHIHSPGTVIAGYSGGAYVTLDGFSISSTAPEENSLSSAVIRIGHQGHITLSNLLLTAADGLDGVTEPLGADPPDGPDGEDGNDAAPGSVLGGSGGNLAGHLPGGNGGPGGNTNGFPGQPGFGVPDLPGGGGGSGGDYGWTASDGQPGTPGSDGALAGIGGASFGSLDDHARYLPAYGEPGSPGLYGSGGGGGGGGGGWVGITGGGGGGGGAGGHGGLEGPPGEGGGGSFGILIDGIGAILVANCHIVTGNGGNGSNGGVGGEGSSGGAGGLGGAGNGNGEAPGGGGNGGDGGDGGWAGCGSGGGGGPSIGIVWGNSWSLDLVNNSFELGSAGEGGGCSCPAGPGGADGERTEVKEIE